MKATKGKRFRPLRKEASDEEIVDWASAHDVFDRLESGVSEVVKDRADLDRVLENSLYQGNTAQLNMRLPRAMKVVLGRLAKERTTDATTLARIWLAERIKKELRSA